MGGGSAQYHERFSIDRKQLLLYHEAYSQAKGVFSAAYQKEVRVVPAPRWAWVRSCAPDLYSTGGACIRQSEELLNPPPLPVLAAVCPAPEKASNESDPE